MSRRSSRGSSRRSWSTTPRRAGSSSTTPPRARSFTTTSPPPHLRVPQHIARLVTRLVAARRRLLRLTQAHRRLLRLRRASGCLGTSRGSSRGSLHHSSSTTLPRVGLSSTTSPLPCVRVPRHVARLVTRLVAPLVVDYSASHRLVVDYFTYAARPGASARCAPRHAARRAARRRQLRLHRASGCLGTSRGSSCRPSSSGGLLSPSVE
jgi:hypothetical protein